METMFGRGYRVLADEIRLTREAVLEEGRLTREFIREERLRSDRRYEHVTAGLDRTIEANTRAWRACMAELHEFRDEHRAEAEAHRAALFRMMDRLGPGPGDAPASA
jgi:hypothetical protein